MPAAALARPHEEPAAEAKPEMLLQDVAIAPAAAPPVTELLPQMLLPAIVAVGLVVGMVVLARKAREGLRATPTQGAGEATTAALLLTLAKVTGTAAAGATETGDAPPAPARPRPVAPGTYEGPVHCPACATQLGVAGPALAYVTRCPACARWIAARVEGQRVIVEARKA